MHFLATILSFLVATVRPRRVRLLLPLLSLVLALPSLNAATFGDFEYTDTGTAITITKYTGNEQVVTIPGTIASKPVTSIGHAAFRSRSELTNVTIPNSVTSIGDSAFQSCTGLTNVTMPNGATSIGDSAFASCSKLTSVTIPNSVTFIGDFAFSYCSGLTSVTIPDSVASIGYYAFYACPRLTSVSIPGTVTSIGDRAFYYCAGLTNIDVATANPSYASADGVLFNRTSATLLQYPAGKIRTSYSIPNSVTSIEDSAFAFCTGLTGVTIPNSVTSIGNNAFTACSGLTSVTIPASVTSIGQSAFNACSSLTSVSIPDGITSIEDYTFHACAGLAEITIPNSVTSIGHYAFTSCSGLTSVTIPASVTSIGSATFLGCSALTSMTIPDGVTYIGKHTFYGCSGLTSMTISEGVTYIGSYAFYGCSGLTSVSIPDSVISLGESAFSQCSSLISVSIPDGITLLEYATFAHCSGLTSVSIPASITSIADSAFSHCGALTSAHFQGDAPSTFNTDVFRGTAPAFTIYYRYGAAGFTSPTWKGYKAQALPVIATQPQSQTVATGMSASFVVGAAGTDLTYQWFKGGAVVAGATTSTLAFPGVRPADAGLYDAVVTGNGGETLSRPIVVGVVPAAGERTAGAVTTRPEWQDIRHPVTGYVYDQFLLTGPAGTFTAAGTKIARMSYLDTNGSIVQVEMSGAGAITVVLDNATGPMDPSLYNQPGIQYMKGKATIILAGADATTHFTIYSVGTVTNPGVTRAGTAYNGWADVAAAGIISTDGKLGGIHQGNASYNAALGYTGIYAPTVTAVGGLVVVHGIAASADALPYLYFGTGGLVKVKIAGTALAQPNTDSLIVGGLAEVQMSAGQDSCGRAAPAAAIATRLLDDAGDDHTTALVVGP